LVGHEGEISKVCFNPQGSRILTASSDKSARIWEVETGGCMQVKLYCTLTHFFKESTLEWLFRGREVILGTCRDSNESMRCKRMSDFFFNGCFRCILLFSKILEGHTDEIFSCAFNYEGDTIITGSKDNTCRIWKCS
jgi:dynein assembly factor with WDR repeat domains 1